jgi:ATP-dependent DNA helicase RecQ
LNQGDQILTSKVFLDKCLSPDIEISSSETIYHLGVLRGDVTFERKGRVDLQSALQDLDAVADPVEYVLGHDLLDHELPSLES